jgi:hypothetical protein
MRYLVASSWFLWLPWFVRAEDSKSFASKEAQEAQADYKKALEALKKPHTEAWKELHRALRKDLIAARKKALEADDLDEAQRVLMTVKYLESLKTGEATTLSVLSARWVTAKRNEDVTKLVKECL